MKTIFNNILLYGTLIGCSIILGLIQFVVLGFMTITLIPIWRWSKREKIQRYIVRLFISIDQFFNTILLGDEDLTISARLARKTDRCLICRFLCWALSKIDPNHCQKALESEKK